MLVFSGVILENIDLRTVTTSLLKSENPVQSPEFLIVSVRKKSMREELFGFLTSINIILNINIKNKHKYSPV